MTKTLKSGDAVRWDTFQGETKGTVVKKLTKDTKIKGFTAKASPEAPRYLVTSAKSAKQAAHKAEELKKA